MLIEQGGLIRFASPRHTCGNMVFGMKSKASATKATKPSPKKTAAGQHTPRSGANNAAAASRKKGLKKSSGVAASSSSTQGASTASGGTKQTKKTLGVKSTSSNSKLKTTTVTLKRSTGSMSTSRSAHSQSSSKASSRASVASSIVDDIEEREGADVREQAPKGSKREKSSVVQALEQELAVASEGSADAAARNNVEEETAPYGGLEDKYALDDGGAEDPPLDPNALEAAKDDEEEDSYDEDKIVGEDNDDDNDEDAGLNPTQAAGDGQTAAADAVADRHHRSPKSPPSKARTTRRSSNEREHSQDRKEKKKPTKPRERTPRDQHHRHPHRARSPPSARPTSRTKGRSRPRRNDADRVDEYLKTRDANSYDEDDATDAPPKSRFKKKVEEGVEEVHGTTQDILLSVFQVCCAFALRGKEINGFVREIDNARAELR